MVKSQTSRMGKRTRSVSALGRRENSAATEETPALPRPHCEMCGASECLRPWLDDRCHCNACLEAGEDDCDSPRMKARRAAAPSCASFFASKCYKSKFEGARQKTHTPVLKQCSSIVNVKKQYSQDNEKAEAELKKKGSMTSKKETPRRKASAPASLSLPVSISHKPKSASDRLESLCSTAPQKIKRSASAQSQELEQPPGMTSTVTPFSAGRSSRSFSKRKDACAKQLRGSSSKRSACSGATISTAASSDSGSAAQCATSSRGRPRSGRKTAGFESPAALPRPHCEMCGASECLRPSLDDRCHCNACLRIEGQECDSPRMRTRRLTHPSCASFYASKCLKDKFPPRPKPVTNKAETPKVAEVCTATKPASEEIIEERLPSREQLRTSSRSQLEPAKRSCDTRRRLGSAEQKVQLTLPLIPRAASKHHAHTCRGNSRKRDPSIESPPQLPRPHCERCGVSECLRPWLDDRCHCVACVEDVGYECDSPRMKMRRASKPSCATFYASRCMKPAFEQKTVALSGCQDGPAELEGTEHKKRPKRKPAKKSPSVVAAACKQNNASTCSFETLQPPCKQSSKSVKEETIPTLALSTSRGNWSNQASAATINKKSNASSKPRSRAKVSGASCGVKSRRKRDPSVEAAPALPRPHCAQCGHNECLRAELDDRCHCEPCLEKGGEKCDSPRMKARGRSRPSCDSFYASKSAQQVIERACEGTANNPDHIYPKLRNSWE